MAELKTELTANIKDLEAKLKKASSLVDGYGDKVDRESNKATKGFNKTNKSVKNVTPTLLEFNRVIQDAPFGIQGVANNIQQLTANFGNLKQSAGGTLPALKALASGFLGPAGILFIVSTLTSLLTVYGKELFKSTTEVEKLAKAQEALAKELEDYRNTLTGVNKARLEGNRAAAVELTRLRVLRTQIENTNLSQELRKDGIRQLQKEFPSYFKNVKEEALLNGSLKKTYDELTESIIKRAKSVAATNLLVENAKKEIIINQQLDDLKEKATQKELELQKARQKGSQASTNVLVGGAGSYNAKLVEQGAIQKDINDLTKEQLGLQEKLNKIGEQNQKLSTFVQANVAIDPTIKLDKVKIDASKATPVYTEQDLANIFGVSEKGALKLGEQARKLSEVVNSALQDSATPVKGYLSNIESDLVDFNANVNDIIQNGIANTFAGIGEAIGGALAQGESISEALGRSLLSTMGGLLTQLGEMAISTGIGIAAVQTALKSLNPYVAIAAGVALVALGSAFASSAKSLGSSGSSNFNSSGSVSGQGSGGVNRLSGGSLSSGVQGGRVVFEISGQKLIGVLNNTLEGNKRLGGNISIS